MTACPTLATERLRLRPYALGDFAAYAAFYASARAALTGGPFNRRSAWFRFASEAGSWALRGYGYWTVEQGGAPAGHIGLIQNAHDPEPELGWILYDGFEGQGFAYEGAFAARAWAYAHTALDRVVSYIDPENTRSIALAGRLGAELDPKAAPQDPGDLVYRHPAKAVLQ